MPRPTAKRLTLPVALAVPALCALAGPQDGRVVAGSGSGLVPGEQLGPGGAAALTDENVGTDKQLVLGSLALVDGSGGRAPDYTLEGGTHRASVTPATLTLASAALTKVYDATTAAAVDVAVIGGPLFAGDHLSGTDGRLFPIATPGPARRSCCGA